MKRLIPFAALLVCLTSGAATHADFVKATPEQRCKMLSEYASDVAIVRDLGMPLKEVKETNGEKYRNNILMAHDMAAEMIYRNSDVSPENSTVYVYNGCMQGLEDVRSARP